MSLQLDINFSSPSPHFNPAQLPLTIMPTQQNVQWKWPNISGLGYGADYNPEQWPRDVWQEDVKLMKEAGVNVVSIGIFSWALLEPKEGQWDFGWMDEVFDLLHQHGVGVDLGTATASPPPWLTVKHPEILPVLANGDVLHQGGRQHWRPSSPIYREYAGKLVRKLAERYGKHPGLVAWHVNNELGCHNHWDYSPDAEKAFRKWLEKKYAGDVEKLNAAWGTAFWSQHYASFDEVQPPRKAATYPNPGQQLDYRRFSSDILKEWYIFERDLLKSITPDVPVTTNLMIMGGGGMDRDYTNWTPEMEFVSNDHYVTQGRDELSFAASLTSGMSRHLPWFLMEHSTSAVNWQDINTPKRPNEMFRDSLSHVAHGADAVCYFQWRQSRAGAEKYHSAMVPHAGPDSDLYRDVVKLGQYLKDLEEIKGSKKETAEVGILFDVESWWISQLDSHPSNQLKYHDEVLSWFVALTNAGIRVDVIPASTTHDLSPYKLLLGPILHVVPTSLRQRITQYVEAGGHFVTTYFSGIVNEEDHIILGGYPGTFRELLGIRIQEFGPIQEGGQVELDDGSKGDLWADPIDIKNDKVEVLLKYKTGAYAGRPAITRLKAEAKGGGSATYISTRLRGEAQMAILKDILAAAGVKSGLKEKLVGKIEQIVRTDGKKRWEFLINRTDEELELDLDLGKGGEGEVLVSTGKAGKGKIAPRGVVVRRL